MSIFYARPAIGPTTPAERCQLGARRYARHWPYRVYAALDALHVKAYNAVTVKLHFSACGYTVNADAECAPHCFHARHARRDIFRQPKAAAGE